MNPANQAQKVSGMATHPHYVHELAFQRWSVYEGTPDSCCGSAGGRSLDATNTHASVEGRSEDCNSLWMDRAVAVECVCNEVRDVLLSRRGHMTSRVYKTGKFRETDHPLARKRAHSR